MVFIGGSDQSELAAAAPGDEENNSAVGFKMCDGVIFGADARDHDVRAPDQADGFSIDPSAARVHQLASLQLETFAGQRVLAGDAPVSTGSALPGFRADIVGGESAVRDGIQDILDDEAGGTNSGIVEQGGGVEAGARQTWIEPRHLVGRNHPMARDSLRAGEAIVEPQSGSIREPGLEAIHRQEELKRLDKLGSDAQQDGALAQRLPDQVELRDISDTGGRRG